MLERLLEPLRADPVGSALLFDFDGTLSPTVDDPADARLAVGFGPRLAQLGAAYRTVAVVSGRPVSFLSTQLPGGIVLSGQYGLERFDEGGVIHRHPGVGAVDIDATVAALVERGVDPTAIEPKGLSLTVHFRTRPAEEVLIREAVEAVGRTHGLVAHEAKRSVELRPGVDVDKGVVVHELADGAAGVLYVGDDLGDLPAFAALSRLRADGVTTVGIAVAGPEAPAALLDVADVAVTGTAGVGELLSVLASVVPPPSSRPPSPPPSPRSSPRS